MATTSPHRFPATIVGLMACMVLQMHGVHADEIVFDLPSSIECREVTTKDFSKANPQLKQIECKVRISALEIEGAAAEIVQFDYEILTGTAIRVLDYEPKTLMESSVVQDQIDVTAAAEDSQANGLDAHIAYKPVMFGGSCKTTAKQSEAKHFKQLAAKDVVLASGTVGREHGVFFRVRPSRSMSFEGSHEFVVIAAVSRGWRADVCHISCTAKVSKKAAKSVSIASLGGLRTPVGMYMRGDVEAAASAEELRRVQDQYQQLVVAGQPKPGFFKAISRGAQSMFNRDALQSQRLRLEEAANACRTAEHQLEVLSSSSPTSD